MISSSHEAWRLDWENVLASEIFADKSDTTYESFFTSKRNYFIPTLCYTIPRITHTYKLYQNTKLFTTLEDAEKYLLNRTFKAAHFYYIIYVVEMSGKELLRTTKSTKNGSSPCYYNVNDNGNKNSKDILPNVSLLSILSLYNKSVKHRLDHPAVTVDSDQGSKLPWESRTKQQKIAQQQFHHSTNDNHENNYSSTCSLV